MFRSSVGEKGPFEKLTKQPILGNGTTDETHEYRYADDAIDPCKDYWYYVESIGTTANARNSRRCSARRPSAIRECRSKNPLSKNGIEKHARPRLRNTKRR